MSDKRLAGQEAAHVTKRRQQRELPDPSAEAFLNMARQYQLAANTLVPISCDVESPLYFLYTHTIELTFKAFLRSHKERIPKKHDLRLLIQLCRDLGLRVPVELNNVIELLDSENCVHGFRYFVLTSTVKPEINYLRKITEALFSSVTEEVRSRPEVDPRRAVAVKLTIGEPVKR
jgi:hypothetical protein